MPANTKNSVLAISLRARAFAVGAVLRHEFDQRAAVAEVEHREVHGDRPEQHPQPVLGRAEM